MEHVWRNRRCEILNIIIIIRRLYAHINMIYGSHCMIDRVICRQHVKIVERSLLYIQTDWKESVTTFAESCWFCRRFIRSREAIMTWTKRVHYYLKISTGVTKVTTCHEHLYNQNQYCQRHSGGKTHRSVTQGVILINITEKTHTINRVNLCV